MNLHKMLKDLDKEITRLETENSRLRLENEQMEKELDALYGYHVDTCKLNRITRSSELIELIEERYKHTGMKVITCKPTSSVSFTLEIGPWNWDGKVPFIGKQYFRTKRFSRSNCDGYDDPGKYITEILDVKDLGFGGIANNWLRERIIIPKGFEFDKTIGL